LQLTAVHSARSAGGPTLTRHGQGFELGLDRRGRPAFTIAGQPARPIRDRLGMSTTTTVILIGGVVLVVAVLASVAAAQPTPGPHEGAFD
jgi:hypothetical protein